LGTQTIVSCNLKSLSLNFSSKQPFYIFYGTVYNLLSSLCLRYQTKSFGCGHLHMLALNVLYTFW